MSTHRWDRDMGEPDGMLEPPTPALRADSEVDEEEGLLSTGRGWAGTRGTRELVCKHNLSWTTQRPSDPASQALGSQGGGRASRGARSRHLGGARPGHCSFGKTMAELLRTHRAGTAPPGLCCWEFVPPKASAAPV